MRICDVECYTVRPPHDDSVARSMLVRITGDGDLAGWGEAVTSWSPARLAARREALLPIVLGHSVFDVEELLAQDVLRDSPLSFAFETAMWDLIGRSLEQPLCHLWGGRYRRRIPAAVRLPCDQLDALRQVARELAEQGVHCQMISSSGEVSTDLERLAAARQATGERVELQLDGCASYEIDDARELCREIGADAVQFLVDPLRDSSPNQLAHLERQVSTPLAVSRGIAGPADVLEMHRHGVAAHLVVQPGRVGGLSAARRCAAVAEAGGLHASLGCDGLAGISLAAMLHAAASTPGFTMPNPCPYQLLLNDLLVESLEMADGMFVVPQGPGLGVEVDASQLEPLPTSA
jgi:L-alanine-DL-glutamate epimerase-like enolase superfamily enzyme